MFRDLTLRLPLRHEEESVTKSTIKDYLSKEPVSNIKYSSGAVIFSTLQTGRKKKIFEMCVLCRLLLN